MHCVVTIHCGQFRMSMVGERNFDNGYRLGLDGAF